MTNNIINWLDILVFFFKESLKRETTFKADFSYLLVFPCTCSQDEDISVELACLRKEITHEHGKKKHLSPLNSPEYGVATFYKDSNAPCWDFSVEALPWNYKGLVGELSRAVYLFITNNMPTARISNFKSIMHQQIKEHGKFWAWCYWQLLLNISLKNVKVRKFSLRINLLVSQNVYKKVFTSPKSHWNMWKYRWKPSVHRNRLNYPCWAWRSGILRCPYHLRGLWRHYKPVGCCWVWDGCHRLSSYGNILV